MCALLMRDAEHKLYAYKIKKLFDIVKKFVFQSLMDHLPKQPKSM